MVQLGAGGSGPLRDEITVETLEQMLREALQPELTRRAHEVASHAQARSAAERLTNEFG